MIEVKHETFFVLNFDSNNVLQDILLVCSSNNEEVLSNIDDVFKSNNIEKGERVEVLSEGNFYDCIKSIKVKEGYMLSKYGYTTIDQYNQIMKSRRIEQYTREIDPQITALQSQLALQEITQKEYEEGIKKIKERKEQIKREFETI